MKKVDIELKNVHGNLDDAVVTTLLAAVATFQAALTAAGLNRHIDVQEQPLST